MNQIYSLTAFVLLSLSLAAQTETAAVFSDHMVLQRGKPIAIWGVDTPATSLSVTLDGKKTATTVGRDGRWLLHLPRHAAGGPFVLRIKGTSEIVLSDILVGEVWICSGQSNMEWPMKRFKDTTAAAAGANDNQLRILHIPKHASEQPQTHTTASWQVAAPDNLPMFTAVGYGFGDYLRKSVGVPIGLIQSAWGGTRAEAWTREAALAKHQELTPILDNWAKIFGRYPAAKSKYDTALAAWKNQSKAAKAASQKVPRKPRPPIGRNDRHAPSRLFHGMITPLVPMSIRGVIWYQGESNATRAYQYRTLFPVMITDWRDAFGQGQFPFLFAQLAAFEDGRHHPNNWAELREAQAMTLSLPNTGMACLIDIGEKKNIHPPHKLEVGRRLGLLAMSLAYGEELVSSGPMFSHFEVDGDQIRLFFDHVGAGLVNRRATDDLHLKGFEIATVDGEFVAAEARIEGRTVVVDAAAIKQPRHVRYAWRHWPLCDLSNKDGLPASPFRTDTRKGVTADAR